MPEPLRQNSPKGKESFQENQTHNRAQGLEESVPSVLPSLWVLILSQDTHVTSLSPVYLYKFFFYLFMQTFLYNSKS